MAFTFGDVRKSLKKKGFVEEKGRHHIFLRHFYKGRKTHIYTKCSHGADSDDIRDGVASSMKMQLDLNTRKQLDDLVACPLTADMYLDVLKEKNSIPK